MTAVPESREPAEARRRLVAAARRVNRMWALTVFGSAAFCLFWVVLGVAACAVGEWAVGAICLVPAVPLGYNVARFLPRTPEVPPSWFAPSVEDEQLLQDWLAGHVGGWRPDVALAPDVRVEVVEGRLVLGLPLIACLREEEVSVLVRDARELHEPDTHPAVARADRLVRGGIPGRHLALLRAREAWAHAVRSRRDDRWPRAVAAATTVDEAQQILQQWLDPALDLGKWHADAFSGLRDFLDAWESVGADVWGGPRLGAADARDVLPVVSAYEREIIERTLHGVPHETEPISWDDHAQAVDVAIWRRQLSTGLEAAERATGTTQPATLDAVLTLLDDGWGASIAAVLVPATPADEESHGEPLATADPAPPEVQAVLLRASLALALTDAGLATPIWSWPDGTVLVDHDARQIDVRALALDALASGPGEPHQLPRLRTWLEAQGLDLATPLWLDEGSVDLPERALMAFPSYRWLMRRDAVISDRAVRVFPTKDGKVTGEPPKVEVRHAEVVGATIGPGLMWGQWLLKLRTPDRVVRVRGMGDGRKQARLVRVLLGDRLVVRWLDAPGAVRAVRSLLGLVALLFGPILIGIAAIAFALPTADFSRTDAALLGLVGLGVLGLAALPDLLATPLRRRKRR